MARAALGDAHNFGRRVSVRGRRIAKPRSLFWEWLLLDAQSPLRRALGAAAEREGLGAETFAFLPSLAFVRPRAREGGEVERIALAPLGRLSASGRRALGAVTGRALALFSWLGLADLHWENLALGRSRAGAIVLAPLDVEIVLSDLRLPTETKLLPDPDPEYAAVCRHAAGVRRVLPFLGKPIEPEVLVAMASAYREMFALLEGNRVALAEALRRTPGLAAAPIRVCLRGTDEYVRARSVPLDPPLLRAEVEQLERGDIPYFFRCYGRRGIHYYASQNLGVVRRLPLSGDVPQLEPLLDLERGFRARSRRTLGEDGLFALLGAFDDESLRGEYPGEALTVRFGARTLTVSLPSGETLRSRRNLRDLVASVYLPCRCGEVRTVLVPPVTVCRTTGGRA